MWARSEYAGELAVLSTWLCALLPWSVTLFSPTGITAFYIRFLPFRFLYIIGAQLPGERPFLFAWEVPGFVGTRGETLASHAWLVGLVAFLLPLGLSVVYYAREEAVETRLGARHTLGLLAALPVFALGTAWSLSLPGSVLLQVGVAGLVPLAVWGLFRIRSGESGADGPVRAIGLLLLGTGLVFLVAAGLLWEHTAGTTVPVGALFQVGFGVVLVWTKRV